MSKRQKLKATWRAIHAQRDKQQMAEVNHCRVMNSKNYFHLI